MGTGVDPSIQCSNGQIVVSWDLGGVGGGPRGYWGRSVNTMFKWTNSGFVGPGGVGGGPRGYWGQSVNTMFKWTNSGFVGPGGPRGSRGHYNGQMDK